MNQDVKFSREDMGVIADFVHFGNAIGLRPGDGRVYQDIVDQSEHVVEFLRMNIELYDAMRKRVEGNAPRIVVPPMTHTIGNVRPIKS